MNRSSAAQDIEIDVYVREEKPEDVLRRIRRDLLETPRKISSRYFYDDKGSRLFERITELPEYYQTRTERQMLQRISDELLDLTQVEELVELGSGASSKTRVLLDAMQKRDQLRLYVPFDVSEGIVRRVAEELTRDYDNLKVHGVIGTFDKHLEMIPRQRKRLLIFLGGTIGNFSPSQAVQFLKRVQSAMSPGEHLLLGTDLIKDVDVLEAAYNDTAGVTAEFNLNILEVINRITDANFELQNFEHEAIYNRDFERIEMWVRSKRRQQVDLVKLGLRMQLDEGSGIRTELSLKYDRPRIQRLVELAGLEIVQLFTDPQELFSLTLVRRPPGAPT